MPCQPIEVLEGLGAMVGLLRPCVHVCSAQCATAGTWQCYLLWGLVGGRKDATEIGDGSGLGICFRACLHAQNKQPGPCSPRKVGTVLQGVAFMCWQVSQTRCLTADLYCWVAGATGNNTRTSGGCFSDTPIAQQCQFLLLLFWQRHVSHACNSKHSFGVLLTMTA